MLPVWVERYKLRTKLLTDRDVKHGEELVRKLNGRVYGDIERHLIASETFRARYAAAHQISAIEKEQQRIFAKIDEHAREDRMVHDRVQALESEMSSLKDDIHEVRVDVRSNGERLIDECKQIRKENVESERRIVNDIKKLLYEDGLNRRKEPRAHEG